jgi:hypothetical protein
MAILNVEAPAGRGTLEADDMRAVLGPCFGRDDLAIKVCELPAYHSQGYSSIVLTRARSRRADSPIFHSPANGGITVAGLRSALPRPQP